MAIRRTAATLSSPVARRVYIGLVVLLIAFLWANMVRRALQGHGSQYDDFVEFSRDLLFERLNIYREYDWARTSIGKYPPFFSLLFAPLVPLPAALGASIWFLVSLGAAAGAAYLAARTVARDWRGESRRISLVVIPLVLASGIIRSNLETAESVNIVILFFLCAAGPGCSSSTSSTSELIGSRWSRS